MKLAVTFAVAACLTTLVARAESLQDTILRAGTVSADAERLAILRALNGNPELTAEHAADLAKVLAEVERWSTDPKLNYFDRPFLTDSVYDFGLSQGSPFAPIERLYQARMFVWVTLEYGGYWSDPAARRKRLDDARRQWERLADDFPDSALVGMYLGKPVAPATTFPAVHGAPEWAVYQREGIERLADIITWWLDHRQREDGQYGGGWGDDCEMWRWWVPVLIAFDDPKITAAQAKLSRGLFAQEHMRGGYTSHIADVEHTAEDSADTITPMMHLEPSNSEWNGRAMRLVELMESLWTGINERGGLQFKSTYFSVDKVDLEPARACDTVYHPRTVQPALLLWQRTADARLGTLFTSWMDTWVDAAAREERGKPAGIIPSAIHWPDGAIGGLGTKWWDPENHNSDPLYVWPSAMGSMTNTMLLAFHMTSDEKYLAPLRSMAAVRKAYVDAPPDTAPNPGSAMWCGSKLGFLTETLAKYRLLTGSTEFDDLLQRENAPYLRFRLSRDMAQVVNALRETAEALRVNFPSYTSEVRYTDRVLRFPSLFQENGMYPDAIEGMHEPDPALLYSTATGDPGNAGYFPMNAVRWLTPPRDIAALVTESGQERFEARLFHFGDAPRSVEAELYLLQPGDYALSLRDASNDSEIETQAVRVEGSTTRITFTLPARRECVLRITPAAS